VREREAGQAEARGAALWVSALPQRKRTPPPRRAPQQRWRVENPLKRHARRQQGHQRARRARRRRDLRRRAAVAVHVEARIGRRARAGAARGEQLQRLRVWISGVGRGRGSSARREWVHKQHHEARPMGGVLPPPICPPPPKGLT
jgi:hypothetical protein